MRGGEGRGEGRGGGRGRGGEGMRGGGVWSNTISIQKS